VSDVDCDVLSSQNARATAALPPAGTASVSLDTRREVSLLYVGPALCPWRCTWSHRGRGSRRLQTRSPEVASGPTCGRQPRGGRTREQAVQRGTWVSSCVTKGLYQEGLPSTRRSQLPLFPFRAGGACIRVAHGPEAETKLWDRGARQRRVEESHAELPHCWDAVVWRNWW